MATSARTVVQPSSSGKCSLTLSVEGSAAECKEIPVEFANADQAKYWSIISNASKFTKWVENFGPRKELQLHRIEIQAVNIFNDALSDIKINAEITRKDGTPVPGSVLIRGDTVAVLTLLRVHAPPNAGRVDRRTDLGNPIGNDEDGQARPRDHVIFCRQARAGTADADCYEIPSGTLEYNGSFASEAVRELRDNCGIQIHAPDLINLTSMAFRRRRDGVTPLPRVGVATAPGLTDERVQIFLYRETITNEQLVEMKKAINSEQLEKRLELVPLGEAWRHSTDAKTMAALFLLYELRYHGNMPKYLPPTERMTVFPVASGGKRKAVYANVGDIDPNKVGNNFKVKVLTPVELVQRARRDGSTVDEGVVVVGDATGIVKLKLGQEQVKLPGLDKAGTHLYLRNVSYDMSDNRVSVVVGKWGKIALAPEEDASEFKFDISTEVDVSATVYTKVVEQEYDYQENEGDNRRGNGRRGFNRRGNRQPRGGR